MQLAIQQGHIRTSVVREGEIECFHKATKLEFVSFLVLTIAGEDGEHPPSYVTHEELQKLVQGFNDQLNENMVAAQKNMVAEVVKALRAQGAAGSPEEELDETDEEYAARLQQEEQGRKNVLGRGRGGGRGGDVEEEAVGMVMVLQMKR